MLSVVNRTGIMVTWDRPLDDGHLQLLHYSVNNFSPQLEPVVVARESFHSLTSVPQVVATTVFHSLRLWLLEKASTN